MKVVKLIYLEENSNIEIALIVAIKSKPLIFASLDLLGKEIILFY